MTKRILVVAAALVASALLTTSAFAQTTCPGWTGNNVQFIGVGSSAQFNTLAYAAIDYANALLTANGITATPQIWSAKNGKGTTKSFLPIQDTRFGTPNGTGAGASPIDTANMWIVWAPTSNNASTTDCYLWAYYQVDSTVGVKDFFSYKKITSPTATTVAAVYPVCLSGSTGCAPTQPTVFGSGQSIIPGQTDAAAVPAVVQTFLTTPQLPTSATGPKPLAYCGQKGTVAVSYYCYFNVGGTDIRPEDALFATTRALSAYSTTNGLSGLGYGQTACGAASTNQGCPIYSSQGTGSVFSVLNFKITGNDPVTGALEPAYGTLSTGASPLVVFVANADTAANAFGSVQTGGTANKGPYVHTSILRANLAMIYEGATRCTGDILDNPSGAGSPIQVLNREPLSGTYNSFEYTGIRTLHGSSSAKTSIPSTLSWVSADAGGQEFGNNPITNFGGAGCTSSGSVVPTADCGDPLYISNTTHCGGNSLRLRAVGSGEEVKAVIGANSGQNATPDGIGYAFWSYQNFNPLISSANCSAASNGNSVCTSYAGHYLAVDGLDPLFANAGGDPTPGITPFNLPQCNAITFSNAADFPCMQIPFTHVLDGSYPLWSLLRLVTFATSGSSQVTPVGVINTVAYAQTEASSSAKALSDFVPFLKNLTNSGTLAAPNWNGNLNLGVFRSHTQTGSVNPDNGHYKLISGTTYGVCSTSSIALVGAKRTTPVCWVDAGGDMGGAVLTVRSDLDFIQDFGLTSTGAKNPPNPVEIYNLHQ